MSCFVHRKMLVEKVQRIGVRIEQFSQVESSGRYSCTLLQDENSEWTLEVQACGEEVQVYLRRESAACGEQFVQVQLMVDDRMGSLIGLRSGRKSLTFRGPTDFRNVMSFRKGALNRWWFLPQDTMTIRGELTVYSEVEEVSEEFRFRFQYVWNIVQLLGLLCAVYIGAVTAVQFVWDVVIPSLCFVLQIFCVLMIVAVVVYGVVENYLNPKTNIPRARPTGNALVPARNGSVARMNSSGRFRRNRRMRAYDPATNRYYEYEESYAD